MSRKSLFDEVELYDLAEISEITGVSVATLRRYIREGRLLAHRLGGKYQATKRQVEAFLEGERGASHEEQLRVLGDLLTQPEAARATGQSFDEGAPGLVAPVQPAPSAPSAVARIVDPSGVAPLSNRPPAPGGEDGEAEGRAAGGPPQLLFMKPEDVDKLVSSLAVHTERIEHLAAERDRQVMELVSELREESRRLRQAVQDAREESRQAVTEMSSQIVSQVMSPQREETDRIRFTWLRGKMEEILDYLGAVQAISEEEDPRRRWWCFWAR